MGWVGGGGGPGADCCCVHVPRWRDSDAAHGGFQERSLGGGERLETERRASPRDNAAASEAGQWKFVWATLDTSGAMQNIERYPRRKSQTKHVAPPSSFMRMTFIKSSKDGEDVLYVHRTRAM